MQTENKTYTMNRTHNLFKDKEDGNLYHRPGNECFRCGFTINDPEIEQMCLYLKNIFEDCLKEMQKGKNEH